jgi:hypothetical protein
MMTLTTIRGSAAVDARPWEAFVATAGRQAANPGRPVAAVWRSLVKDLLDPYRPERHYMRGPGPRWRAKHGHAASRPLGLSVRRYGWF